MAPCGSGSELGGGDEGCVGGGGGKGRGVEGAEDGASGGGALDFGEGSEGVQAENRLPGVGGIIGGDGSGRATGGGGDCTACDPQCAQSVPYAHIVISELEPPSSPLA